MRDALMVHPNDRRPILGSAASAQTVERGHAARPKYMPALFCEAMMLTRIP